MDYLKLIRLVLIFGLGKESNFCHGNLIGDFRANRFRCTIGQMRSFVEGGLGYRKVMGRGGVRGSAGVGVGADGKKFRSIL
jgi:hypothetical protein